MKIALVFSACRLMKATRISRLAKLQSVECVFVLPVKTAAQVSSPNSRKFLMRTVVNLIVKVVVQQAN